MTKLMMLGAGRRRSSAYAANATRFTASTDYMRNDTFAYGSPNYKKFSVSLWFYVPTTAPTGGRLLWLANSGGTARLYIQFYSSNRVGLDCDNSSGTSLGGRGITGNNVAPADQWNHLMWSVNTETQAASFYINDTNHSSALNAVVLNATLDTLTRMGVPDSGANSYDTWMSEVYVNVGEYIDFSSSSERAKFRTAGGKPVNLGATGSIPTGTAPTAYFKNPFGTFGTNEGSSASDLTVTGTLDAAPSSPSD